jgi:hypothetical protein
MKQSQQIMEIIECVKIKRKNDIIKRVQKQKSLRKNKPMKWKGI